jgi:AcrR family transcriptional regulator
VRIKILGTDQTVGIPDNLPAPETEAQAFENLARHRQRAAAMTADQRREAILKVALPLLCEHGERVTTSQIAQAAGIAEGTIFRVFPEKRELLRAALRRFMSGDAEVEQIGQIDAGETPLEERLIQALGAIEGYRSRFWALRAFRHIGWMPDPEQPAGEGEAEHPIVRIATAFERLIEPDAAQFRLPAGTAARMLVALAFSNGMGEGLGEPPATEEQIVDLFLNGALVAEGR